MGYSSGSSYLQGCRGYLASDVGPHQQHCEERRGEMAKNMEGGAGLRIGISSFERMTKGIGRSTCCPARWTSD